MNIHLTPVIDQPNAGPREQFMRLTIAQQITIRAREVHALTQRGGLETYTSASLESLRLDMTRWCIELEDAAFDVTQIMAENTRLRLA